MACPERLVPFISANQILPRYSALMCVGETSQRAFGRDRARQKSEMLNQATVANAIASITLLTMYYCTTVPVSTISRRARRNLQKTLHDVFSLHSITVLPLCSDQC